MSGQSITMVNLPSLITLLPANKKDFYRYNGSLTTPLCNEAVVWTVFDSPIKVSQQQVNSFIVFLLEK